MEKDELKNILRNNIPQSKIPLHKIKRVEIPTTIVSGKIERIDMRDTAYGLAARGEYGKNVQSGVQNTPPGKYPLSAAQKDIIDHLATLTANPVAEYQAPIDMDPRVLTRHIKAVGYFLKADLMGACRVPETAYYSHDKQGNPVSPRFKNAVIIVMKKDWKTIRASKGNDWIGDPLSFQAYGHLALVAETLTNYIRRLGWEASPQYGPSFVNCYSVLLPPLLLAAGIGEVSRVGIILNPYLGLSYKAAAILTDMPIDPDLPVDFGLQAFCRSCRICAENCSSKAISFGDKVIYNGYETWKLNTQRCASYNFTNQNGTMCNKCIKVCPWSQPASFGHNLVRTVVMNIPVARTMAIQAAKLLDPAKSRREDKWWFDFEYKEGVIQKR